MSSPSGSPFADVIQSLAGLHQEHHKALMDMRADQERRFCALVQNQREDRELFRSWMDREVRAGENPTVPAPPTHMPVQKMGPQDDPEAFLDLFEKTAAACGWPQTDWPVRLIPLLTGEAQLAAQQLPVQNLLVYDDLKRAILQRVGRSPEQHRQRFRSLELGENGRPFVMAHQLRDACRRWLLAGEGGVDHVIDQVVLEQFIARLPKATAQWVQCHRPASLDLAIQLAEDQMVACHGVGETLPSVSLSLSSPSVLLVLLPTSSSKLLAKWQGPFEVTRQVGDLNYEVVRTDRSGARQIYHLNLLKKWNEVEPVMLATVVGNEEDLGPEASLKVPSLTLAPGGDHLSPSQLTDVARLQREFADVFSPRPGRTNLIQHHIETEPGVVVRSRPYRLPEHKKKVVQSELEAMLEMGVIEESRSDWASPIVLVPKTDGSVRFCVDYRKVNAVSKFDAYPMPRVDELLDRLGTARFYSTLDLTKGYWQIPLSPLSKEKSAFTTPFGLHQFVTLPFGLFGAPATFQRLMDKILRPHTAYAAAYLDDIIIYSQDWQRHMVHLREVLRALRGAGLTANPKKCAIGRVEVRYLGFHLGHGQVRPQIDKTAAIAACPRPKTKKEVRQFLGLAGYYRRFVPDYSELTSPLTDLTKKEVPDTVPWTERCQQVFTQVKAALCGGPLLHSPDFSLPFLLQTDASDRGLGAVLTQEIGGEERPVLYISRKLSKRETMYSTIEKECLAIRWAVLTLRYYLLGREFTLCSDHAPLQWLHRMKDTNARITRWYLALQPFKFKVIHRPGTQMTVADFLSRNGGGGAAGRRASRPESGGGGMWRGGRGSAKSAAGERLRRQR